MSLALHPLVMFGGVSLLSLLEGLSSSPFLELLILGYIARSLIIRVSVVQVP